MHEHRSEIPRVPYVDGDTPLWAPGNEEPGRTPEEQAEREREPHTIPTMPYEDAPPWAPGNEEPGRTKEEMAERERVAEKQRQLDREDGEEDI